MDLNGDMFIGTEEALPAYRSGLIGPMSPKDQIAWREMKKLSEYWVDNWLTADVDTLWRNGDIGIRTTGAWEFSAQKSDPQIKFERGFLPSPYVTGKDMQDGGDPPEFTLGDGKPPAELVAALGGADCVITNATRDRGTTDISVKYAQWVTMPENDAFLVNENEQGIPATIDAPLGPLSRKSPVSRFRASNTRFPGTAKACTSTRRSSMRAAKSSWPGRPARLRKRP